MHTRPAPAFRILNEAWIGRHFAIEDKDREVLDDPVGKILAKGGRIFMALTQGDAPVGCVAMIPMAMIISGTTMEMLRTPVHSPCPPPLVAASCALTANGMARDVQRPLINPDNHDYTFGEVPHLTADATRSFISRTLHRADQMPPITSPDITSEIAKNEK